MKLIKKYFSDHREWFLRAVLGLVALILLAFLPAVTRVMDADFAMFFVVVVVAAAIVVVTIKVMNGYAGRKTGVMEGLIPASWCAKFWLAWVVSMPGALLVSVAIVLAVNTLFHHTTGVYISNRMFFGVDPLTSAVVRDTILGFLFAACLIHSVVMLATLITTSRGGFLRQGLVGLAIFAVAFTLIIGLPRWLGMPEGTDVGFPFFFVLSVGEGSDGASIWQMLCWVPDAWRVVLSNAVSCTVPLILWVTAYYKFKELEIR